MTQNAPGFVNRKAQMRGEGFDLDDDDENEQGHKSDY